MGRCLGTGPSTDLASRNPVRGLILQSPIMSAIRVVMKSWTTLPFDIFANCDKIHKVNSPVFIMHGKLDNVVPFEHGRVTPLATIVLTCRNCLVCFQTNLHISLGGLMVLHTMILSTGNADNTNY